MSFFSVLNSWTLILTTVGPALLQDCQRLDPEHCCSTLVIPEAKREELSVPQDKDPSLYRLRDANKGSYLREQPWAISHTAVFFAVTQPQARETTSESAFKAQSSNSPPNNIFSADVFKAGFLILIERLPSVTEGSGVLEGAQRAWLQPSSAPASCTTTHEPPGTRSQARKGAPGGFSIHYNTCAPLYPRELGRTTASKVLRYSETLLIPGWIHKAEPSVFLEVLFIQNAY